MTTNHLPLEFFEYAIGILDERGLVDPSRVAVTGLSAGVGDVDYALIHSNLFAASITSGMAFAPNNRALIGASGEFAREYLKVIDAWSYPGPYGVIYPQLSLSLNAERVDTPLLVNVSDSETSYRPFNSTNYSAIGRYISLSITKHW